MRLITVGFITLLVLCLVCIITAETVIEISGQVRVRGAVDDRSFNGIGGIIDRSSLRARLAVGAFVDSNVTAFLQLQDSRDLRLDGNGGESSGERTDGPSISTRQAYLHVKSLLVSKLGLRAGRFEFSHGNERLFGTDDWDTVGLVFNGAELMLGDSITSFRAFGLAGPAKTNGRSSIWGSSIALASAGLEPIFYYEYGRKYQYYGTYTLRERLDRFTAALYGNHTARGVGIEYNLAYQFGRLEIDYSGSHLAYWQADIRAWLVTLEITGALTSNIHWRLGVDANSGEVFKYDSLITQFEAPYRSTKDIRGRELWIGAGTPMNYGAVNAGIVDLYSGISAEVDSFTTVTCDLHHLRTERYFATTIWSTGSALFGSFPYQTYKASNLGWQLDLEMATTAVMGVDWLTGASAFFPSKNNARSTEKEAGYFLFSQMTVNF